MGLDREAIDRLNQLKRHVFESLLGIIGRVFIIVRYHEDVRIGNRGFLPEEKERGIVLVFNRSMRFHWHDWGIEADLHFGNRMEHCVIPVEHIIGVYSPEANAQFLCLGGLERAEQKEDVVTESTDKVVKVDFRRRKGDS